MILGKIGEGGREGGREGEREEERSGREGGRKRVDREREGGREEGEGKEAGLKGGRKRVEREEGREGGRVEGRREGASEGEEGRQKDKGREENLRGRVGEKWERKRAVYLMATIERNLLSIGDDSGVNITQVAIPSSLLGNQLPKRRRHDSQYPRSDCKNRPPYQTWVRRHLAPLPRYLKKSR